MVSTFSKVFFDAFRASACVTVPLLVASERETERRQKERKMGEREKNFAVAKVFTFRKSVSFVHGKHTGW